MNRVMSIVMALVTILLVGTPVVAAQRPVVLEFEKETRDLVVQMRRVESARIGTRLGI